ncbi:GTPase HflX [Bdellovibrio sp. KM01]|uniref:GTPase HflX n=1 Tax=Bdellovibrio sp. KM01 TaxID=2748865 RepID=UPI0015EABBE7|nr:GTPase HflX [Bdellovibrio sp. KM01]QLY24943.1 GTPase HflX [Bdellovibrio sp. KM01]
MSLHETEQAIPKAVLVGLQIGRMNEQEVQNSLTELSRLVNTLGFEVIGKMHQRRTSTKSANVLGDGKLMELAKWTGGTGKVAPTFIKKKHKAALKFEKEDDAEDLFDLPEETFEEQGPEDFVEEENPQDQAQWVIFDCDLSPLQLRNLESATGAKVMDRTGVIIEIFSRHARTRAARLQVEIARLTYVAPRVRGVSAGDDDRMGGGGKGVGESAIELDRRKIRDRIKELKQELSSIGQEHLTRRSQRSQEACVALVGYTNAGKSSLMRAMTGSEVYVADKLFATLDTTVRAIQPETRPKILLSDTVGFIKKLPHDLVASFKSTLDEALNASLLLYMVDASDPSFRSQLEVTRTTLAEVGAGEIPSLLILNKRDCLTEEQTSSLAAEFPDAIFLSTRNAEDVENLRLRLVKFYENSMREEEIFIPYKVQGVIGDIRARLKVLGESYDEKGVRLKVRANAEDFEKIAKKIRDALIDID